LPLIWACEHFSDFLPGLEFHIYTKHKPLVPLFGSKNPDELPVGVQRFRLQFKFTISLVLADALSRALISEAVQEDIFLQKETTVYVNTVVQSLPATESNWYKCGNIRRKMRIVDKLVEYRIAGKFGGHYIWRIDYFQVLAILNLAIH